MKSGSPQASWSRQLISKRFSKKQQIRWTKQRAHLFLQTQAAVLSDELEDAFRQHYPLLRMQKQKLGGVPP